MPAQPQPPPAQAQQQTQGVAPPPEPMTPATAALAAGTVTGVLASAPIVIAPVVAAAAAKRAGKKVADILLAFGLRRMRKMSKQQSTMLFTRHPTLLKTDLQRALKFEEHLEQVFQDRMRERVARDVEQAFLITDPGERHARIQFIMERERRFARMREQAMTDRLEGAATVGLLKQTSPHGALWVLSERVKTHTPDCVALAGHIWPWELLELLHPPVHFGCACYLLSTDSAVKSGLASEWDIPKTAEQRAAKIRQGVRLYKTNVHDGHDHSNLDELAEAHVPNLPDLPGEREILRYKKGLAKGGQFAPKRGGSSASARGREKTARSASKLAQRGDGRWHQIEGRSVFVPRGRDFRRRVNGKDYTSPEGTTSLLVDGKKVVSPADPVQATGTLDLPTVSITRDRARQLADAVGALRDRREPRGTHPLGKELSTTSPDSFADYQAESFALAAHLSEKFGTPTNISKVGTDESEDHAGFTGWDGDVVVGREVIPGIEEDSRLRHSGLPLAYNDLRRSFGHYKVQAHEVSHTVNPTTRREYRDPVGFQLEESLTEEACHVIAIENLARHGRADVIGWYRSNPLDDKVQGSYMQARARLLATLNAIGVNPEEREEVVMDLKFRVRPADRLARLAELSEENDSKHSQAEIRALLTAPVENDTPSRVLVPHYQDVPAKKPTTKSLGVDISEGSRIRFTAPHRPERTGKVVNVVDQNPKQQTLWVQDDFTGEVYPNVSPSHVTAVLSAAGFRNFKDDGNTYREGDAIEYQVDGSWKPAVVTQVIASDQQSWTCEAVDAQGHAMILTGGSVQAIRPVIVDGTPKTRVKARTKRSRPQVGVTGRADKPTPQDQPSPTVDEEALNPAVWAAQPDPGTPPKIVTLNVANSPKLSKPSSPPATKLKLENAVREKREAPSTPDIYADTQRIEASTIAIRTDGRGLAGILESGRVKNWHETDTTTGHFTPQLRAYLEASAFDLPWNPDLQPPEAPAASIYRDAAAAAFKKPWAFPIHGYLDGTGPDPQQHGPFKIKLKGETKTRTTYTATDLFDSTYEQSAAPSPVNNPDPHLSGLLRGDKAAEAQIHGPVTLNDIASIEVPADISKPLSDALDKSGIPWSITNEPEGAGTDRRRAPSSGKGRKVPAYKMPLREFEGYAWNDPTGPHRRRDPGTSDSKLDQMLNLHVGMRDGRKPTGWKYGSTEELVLAEGRNWEPQPLPKDAEPWRGEPQECYSNAAKAVLGMSGLFAHPDWRYVEGYALAKDIPFPIAHAWAVDQDDRVIELTWPDVGLEYRGIEFDHDRLRGILLKREMFGVLDDWQNEYPLLQHGASEGRQDPGSPESVTPTSPESATPRTVRMWHLTDRADFKLDPDFAPFVNTTIGDMGAERKGLYVAPSAEAWFNGYDYVRPFVAEIEVPELPSFGGYSGENFLPADRFGDAKVLRVIPTDEYARETYLGKGWFEAWKNPRKWDEPVQRLPEDYRYEGPDVRDMKPEQVEALRKLTADYIEANRPWINAPEDADGMYDPGVAVDAPRTIPPKPDILDYPDIMDGIQAKRDWTQMLTREVSRGTVDEREAVERGWDPPRRPREGQDRSFQPLPETLYHATTARDAVRREGLRTREDLGVGGSLGGGEPDAISLTTDLDVADSVVIALDEVRALMSGEITFKDLLERADKGDLGSKPFGAELRKALFRQGSGGERYWTEIIDNNAKVVRRGVLGDIERTRDPATAENWAKYGLTPQGEPDERGWYEYGTRPLSHEPVLNERGWYDQSEFADAVNGFHRVFRSHRQEAGGPEDPMLYLTDYDALGKVPADQIVVLEVQPDPKARGYAMYGMEEWRTHSGDALKVTADLTHEELWDKDEGRADPGTVTRPEIPPKPDSYPENTSWERTMDREISAGRVSVADAIEAGYEPDRYERALEPISGDLWHTTTARSKVKQRGLLTRIEIGPNAGLGGGESDTVSVTHSQARAHDIRQGLVEAHDMVVGNLTFEEMMRRADAGQDADRPWGDAVRSALMNTDEKREKWDQAFKGFYLSQDWHAPVERYRQDGYEPFGEPNEKGLYSAGIRPMTAEDRTRMVQVFLGTYLAQREYAGGPKDPIIMDSGKFARLGRTDPDEIVVLRVRPNPGAMGYRMRHEDEWRTWSGRAFRVVADETNHEKWGPPIIEPRHIDLHSLDIPDWAKNAKTSDDLRLLWDDKHPLEAWTASFDLTSVKPEELEQAKAALYAATQDGLKERGLGERVLVWRLGALPGPGPTSFSLSPSGLLAGSQPYIVDRSDIVVDSNAFFPAATVGENEVIVAHGDRAVFGNAEALAKEEGRLDPGTPDFTIPTRLHPSTAAKVEAQLKLFTPPKPQVKLRTLENSPAAEFFEDLEEIPLGSPGRGKSVVVGTSNKDYSPYIIEDPWAKDFDPDFDSKDPAEWIYEMSDDTLADYFDEFNEWDDIPFTGEYLMLHGTTAENAESILKDGFIAQQQTSVPGQWLRDGVWLADDEWVGQSYGDGTMLAVDLAAMKRDAFTPPLERDLWILEKQRREGLASQLGLDDFYDERPENWGLSEDTLVVRDNIPAKYVSRYEPEGMRDLGTALGRLLKPRPKDPVTVTSHQGLETEIRQGPQYRVQLYRAVGDGELLDVSWYGKKSERGNPILATPAGYEVELTSGTNSNVKFIREIDPNSPWELMGRVHPELQGELRGMIRTFEDGDYTGTIDEADRIIEENSQTDMVARVQLRLVAQEMRKRSLQELNGTPLTIPADWDQPKVPIEEFRTRAADFRSLTDAAADRSLWTGDFDLSATDLKRRDLMADKPITVFRALPVGRDDSLLPGDYVTESESYARMYGDDQLGGRYRIESLTLKPSDLEWLGDPQEFRFQPADSREAHAAAVRVASINGREIPENVLAERPPTLPGPSDPGTPVEGRSYFQAAIGDNGTWFETFAEANDALKRTEKLITDMDLEEQVVLAPQDLGRMFDEPPTADELATFGLVPGAASPLERDDGAVGFATATRNKARREVARDLLAVNGAQPLATRDTDLLVSAKIWQLSLKEGVPGAGAISESGVDGFTSKDMVIVRENGIAVPGRSSHLATIPTRTDPVTRHEIAVAAGFKDQKDAARELYALDQVREDFRDLTVEEALEVRDAEDAKLADPPVPAGPKVKQPAGTKMFHVALTGRRKQLEADGLDPHGPLLNTDSGHERGVYLWDNIETARKYRGQGPNAHRGMDIWEVDVSDTDLFRDDWLLHHRPDRAADFPGAWFDTSKIPAARVSMREADPWSTDEHPHEQWSEPVPSSAAPTKAKKVERLTDPVKRLKAQRLSEEAQTVITLKDLGGGKYRSSELPKEVAASLKTVWMPERYRLGRDMNRQFIIDGLNGRQLSAPRDPQEAQTLIEALNVGWRGPDGTKRRDPGTRVAAPRIFRPADGTSLRPGYDTPLELFHVTTNGPEVRANGIIRAQDGGGLGGRAQENTVALSVSRQEAESLAADLRFVGNMYRDGQRADVVEAGLVDRENEGVSLNPGFANLDEFGPKINPEHVEVIEVSARDLANGAHLAAEDDLLLHHGDLKLSPKRAAGPRVNPNPERWVNVPTSNLVAVARGESRGGRRTAHAILATRDPQEVLDAISADLENATEMGEEKVGHLTRLQTETAIRAGMSPTERLSLTSEAEVGQPDTLVGRLNAARMNEIERVVQAEGGTIRQGRLNGQDVQIIQTGDQLLRRDPGTGDVADIATTEALAAIDAARPRPAIRSPGMDRRPYDYLPRVQKMEQHTARLVGNSRSADEGERPRLKEMLDKVRRGEQPLNAGDTARDIELLLESGGFEVLEGPVNPEVLNTGKLRIGLRTGAAADLELKDGEIQNTTWTPGWRGTGDEVTLESLATPAGWREALFQRAAAMADTWGRGEVLTNLGSAAAQNLGGSYDMSGVIDLRPSLLRPLNRAAFLQASGQPVDRDTALAAFSALEIVQHEIGHGVNPISLGDYNGWRKTLLEAVQEETAPTLAIEWAKELGLTSILGHVQNEVGYEPVNPYIAGSYLAYREALRGILEFGTPYDGDHYELFQELKYAHTIDEALDRLSEVTGIDREELVNRLEDPPELLNNIAFKPIIEVNPNVDPAPSGEADEARPNNRRDIFFKKGDLVYADGVLATVLGEHPGVVVVQTADGEAAFKMEHVSRVGSLVADFSWVGDWSGKEGEVIVGSRKSDAPLESSVITAAPGRRVGDPPLDWGDAGPSVGLTRISRLPEGALVISPSGGDVYARGAMVLTRNDWGEGPPFLEPYQFSVRGMGIPESSYVEDTGERVVRFRDLEVGDRYIDNSDSGIVRTVTKTVEDGKLGYAESSLDNLAPEQRTAAEVTMVGMEWVDVLGQPVNVGSIQQGRFMAPDENGFQRVWRTLGRDWFQAGSQAEGQVAARRLSNLDGEAGEVKAFSPDDLVSPLGGGLGDGRRDPGTTEKARWVAGEFVNSNDLNDGDRIVFQWDRMSGEAIIREVRWGVNSLESLNENGDWRPLAADVYPRAIREDDEDGLEGLVPISSLPVGTQFWFGSEQDAVVSRQMIGVRGEDVTRYIVRRRLGGPPVNQSEDHPVNGNTLVRPWDREKVPTIDQLPEEASFKVGAFGYRVAGPATDGGYIPTIDQHGRLQLTRGDLLALDVPEDLDVSVPTEVSIPGESEIVPIENVPTGGLFQRPDENDLKVRLNLGVDERENFTSFRSVDRPGNLTLADSNGTTVRYYPNLVSLRESPVEIRELEIGDRFWNGDMGLVKLTADGYAEPLGTDGVRAVGIYNTVKFVDRAVSDRIMAEVVGVNLGTRVSDVQDGQRFKLTEDGPLIEVVNARSGEALHPEFGTIRLTEEDRRRYVQSASRAVAASVGSHDRFIPTNTNDPNEDGDHRISYYDLKSGDEFLLVGDFGENAAPYYRRTDDGFVRIDPEFGEIDPPDRVVDLIAQNGGTIRRIAIDAQRRIGMQRHERMAKIKAAREEEFWTELNESDGITLRELEYDDRVFLVDGDEGHWWTVQNWHHQKSTEPSAGMGVRRLEREDEDGNTIGKVLPIWTDVEWVEDDTYERLKDGGYLEDLDDPFRDSRYEDVDYGIAQEAFRALAESGGAYDYASWSTSDEYGNSLSVEGSGDSWEVNDTLDGYQSFSDPVDACNYIEGRLGEMEEEAQQRDVDGDEFQAIFDGFEHNGLHINMGYPENNYDGGVEISGSIIDEDGNSVGTINRTLSRDGDELKVYHALMQLDRDQQGKGFATALMEHQIRSYQQAGYDRVEVGAGMNIGGYAWARLGFDCSSAALRNMAAGSDAENAVRDGIQQGVITEDDLEELRAKVEDGEIDNAFDFAGYGSDNPWIRERTLAHTIRPSLDPAHADEWDLIVNIDDEERYERYSSEDAATEALMQYQREAGTPMWIGKSLMLGRTWSGTIDLHSDKPIKRIRQAALDQEKIRKKFKENVQGLRSDRNQMRLFDDLGEKKPLVRPEEPTLGDRDLSTSVPVGSLGNLDTFVALPGTEIPGRGPYTVSLPVYGGTRTYRDATGATITQNEIRGTLEVRPTGATYTRFRQQAVNGGYADVRQEELLPDPSAASESRYPAAKSSIDSYPYLVTVSDLSVGDKFRFQSHNDDDVREVTEVRPDGVSFKRPDSDEIEVMPADEGFRVRPLGDTITRFVDLSLTDTKLNDVKEGEQFWFPGHEEEVYRSIQSGGGTYEAASQASDREGILHSWPAEDDSVVRLYRRVPPSYLRGEATTLSEVRPGRRFWFEDEPLDEHAPYWLKLNGEGYIDSLGNALTEPPAPEAKVVAAPERPQPDNMPVRSTMGEMLATQPFVFLDPERDEQMVPPFTLGGYADPSTLGRQSFVDRDANWDNADYREPVWAEEVTPEAVATNLSELAPLAAVPRYNQFRFQDESLNENAPFSVAATATPLGRRVIFIDKDGNEQTESMYAPVFTKIGIPGYVPAASHEQGAAAEKIRQAKELGESVQINGWWVRNRGENQWVVDRPGFENGSWDSPELAAEVALEEPVGPTEEDADVVERIREKGAAGTVVNGWPVSYSYSSYRIQSEPGIYDGRWGTPEAVAAEALGREQGWYLYEERDRAHESGMTGQEEAGGAFQHLVALETVKPGDQFRFQSSELNGSAPYTSLSPAEYKDVRGRVWPINPSGADNGRFRVWSTGEGVENPDEMEVTKDRIRVGDVFKFPNAEPAGRYRLVREEIADNGSKVWHTERIGGRSEFVYSELPERVIVVGEATTRITLEDLASLGN